MSTAKIGFRCLVATIVSTAVISLASTALAIDPHGAPGKHTGVGIWVTDDGTWHLNTHTQKKKRVFSGTIQVVGAKIRGATGIDKLEKDDSWRIDGKKNTVTFQFTTAGKWDRIDLLLSGHADKVIFDLKVDGGDFHNIHIGHEGTRPESGHFTLSDK